MMLPSGDLPLRRIHYDRVEEDWSVELNKILSDVIPYLKPYLRRSLHPRQMDFETAVVEMLSLLFGYQSRVFEQAYYRKQTKGRRARDDPAFCLCQIGFLAVAMLAFGISLRARRLFTYIYLFSAAIGAHWFFGGILVATVHTLLANRHLTAAASNHENEHSVEWLYAFDIHCNAFFLYFTIAYVGHFFFLPLVLAHSFFAMLLANVIHTTAFASYFYLTYLGFRALPFLHDTEHFLWPVLLAIFFFVFSILFGLFFGIKLNASVLAIDILIAPLTY
uniref:UNC-50 family protein n=1 Tax=Aureoumbra lagunensis TaxID=44058 RepID=A0A7S3JR22_9STRA|mmetsp:Transcript_3378/g.4715  ORF Transcript_3378/g.4715 Transcript_3378/m.4715 type:complete len:277 (+) Transcript_3378:14-844(+)